MSRDVDNDSFFIEHQNHQRDRLLWHAIYQLTERITIMEASQAQNQASIDADTAQVQALGPKLDAIKVEVDALKAAQSQGQALDFSGLDAAVQAVGGQVDADQADAAPAVTPAPSSSAAGNPPSNDPAPATSPQGQPGSTPPAQTGN